MMEGAAAVVDSVARAPRDTGCVRWWTHRRGKVVLCCICEVCQLLLGSGEGGAQFGHRCRVG